MNSHSEVQYSAAAFEQELYSELPWIGDVVAERYRIQSEIDRGGMSAILVALDMRLDREVVIKFLLPNLVGREDIVRRFDAEARILAQLENVHIVQVLDRGAWSHPAGAPLPYVVLERLHGENLSDRLFRTGPMDVATVIQWVTQACAGLSVAHAAGVVHRDLKPSNLFIARDSNGSETLKVLDFGIAKTILPRRSLTIEGESMGSPGYMSPEQIRDARQADARSDVWSLGAVLYELLAGRPPYLGENHFEICASILDGDLAEISSLRPDLPPDLAEVVHKCLKLEPNERFASVDELAVALASFVPETFVEIDIDEVIPLADTLPQLDLTGLDVPSDSAVTIASSNRRSQVELVSADDSLGSGYALSTAETRTFERRRAWSRVLFGIGIAPALYILGFLAWEHSAEVQRFVSEGVATTRSVGEHWINSARELPSLLLRSSDDGTR